MVTAAELRARIQVCMFDQYGTVVDMQTGLTEAYPQGIIDCDILNTPERTLPDRPLTSVYRNCDRWLRTHGALRSRGY
jgi:hypothetical protein